MDEFAAFEERVLPKGGKNKPGSMESCEEYCPRAGKASQAVGKGARSTARGREKQARQ